MPLMKALLEKSRNPLRIFVAVCIVWTFFSESVPYLIESAQHTSERETSASTEAAVQSSPAVPKEPLVININTAESSELIALNGIGTAKARAIVAYREEHGAFSSVDELLNVDGIGEATLDKLREQLTV